MRGLKMRGLLTVAMVALVAIPAPRGAAVYDEVAPINYPGARDTRLFGINDTGLISGNYILDDGSFHGFVYDIASGAYTPLEVPGVFFHNLAKVNNAGDITGIYQWQMGPPIRGFVYRNGWFRKLDYPGAMGTTPAGINDRGDVSGSYRDTTGVTHAFLYIGGQFSSFQYPNGGTLTAALDINVAGDVVGRYQKDGAFHMFLRSGGQFETIDFPGAASTGAAQSGAGLNVWRDVVGQYASGGRTRGFVKDAGGFRTIDFPDTIETVATDINDNGDIVGRYRDLSGRDHGYLLRRVTVRPW
jgi:uncharacterized membrane protein